MLVCHLIMRAKRKRIKRRRKTKQKGGFLGSLLSAGARVGLRSAAAAAIRSAARAAARASARMAAAAAARKVALMAAKRTAAVASRRVARMATKEGAKRLIKTGIRTAKRAAINELKKTPQRLVNRGMDEVEKQMKAHMHKRAIRHQQKQRGGFASFGSLALGRSVDMTGNPDKLRDYLTDAERRKYR